jgi:hypothetical protein
MLFAAHATEEIERRGQELIEQAGLADSFERDPSLPALFSL